MRSALFPLVCAFVATCWASFNITLYEQPGCVASSIQLASTEIPDFSCTPFANHPFRSFTYDADNSITPDAAMQMAVFANSECDTENTTHSWTWPVPGKLRDATLARGCATRPYKVFRDPIDGRPHCYSIEYDAHALPSRSIYTWGNDEDTIEKCEGWDHYIRHPCYGFGERMSAMFSIGSQRRCKCEGYLCLGGIFS